jgi:hypothetical protein
MREGIGEYTLSAIASRFFLFPIFFTSNDIGSSLYSPPITSIPSSTSLSSCSESPPKNVSSSRISLRRKSSGIRWNGSGRSIRLNRAFARDEILYSSMRYVGEARNARYWLFNASSGDTGTGMRFFFPEEEEKSDLLPAGRAHSAVSQGGKPFVSRQRRRMPSAQMSLRGGK